MKLISLFLLCISLQTFGMMPASNHIFHAPNFDGLLPFSLKECNIMKQQKVKKVTYADAFYYTEYYLNDSGNIKRELVYELKKKKKVFFDSVLYTYNNNGQLLVRKCFGHRKCYDSIAYTEDKRVAYYLSYGTQAKGTKWEHEEIYWDLHLTQQTEAETILTDNHDTSFVQQLIFDKNNKAIKVINNLSIDSLATIRTGINTHTINHYYKDGLYHTAYTLWQSHEYKDGLLLTLKTYNNANLSNRYNYIYDEKFNLIQTNTEYSRNKFLYTYDEFGLPLESIYLDRERVSIGRYFYTYFLY